jgi:hypothetical protein
MISVLIGGGKKKMNFRRLLAFCASFAAVFLLSSISVKADGYWQDGYWDEASQVWVEGHWVENGWTDNSGGNAWAGQPYQEYANGGVINYDAAGNWTSTVVGNVPVFSQHNGAWAGVTIGEGGNFGSTGCVPTAMAMIMNHFGFGGSPLDYGYAMNASGNYNSYMGHGADSAALTNTGAAYGLAVNAFSDYDSMYYALQRGKLVAACIGGNSSVTHCVVLYGLDAWGNTNVADPSGNRYRTNIASIVNNMSYNPVDWTAGGPFVAFGYEW